MRCVVLIEPPPVNCYIFKLKLSTQKYVKTISWGEDGFRFSISHWSAPFKAHSAWAAFISYTMQYQMQWPNVCKNSITCLLPARLWSPWPKSNYICWMNFPYVTGDVKYRLNDSTKFWLLFTKLQEMNIGTMVVSCLNVTILLMKVTISYLEVHWTVLKCLFLNNLLIVLNYQFYCA